MANPGSPGGCCCDWLVADQLSKAAELTIDILGASVGNYKVINRVGTGAMAEVYRAMNPETRNCVALKILKSDHRNSPESLTRFSAEGETTAALDHPNIVSMYRTGELSGRPFIMMELLEGGSLQERLSGGHPLPLNAALLIAIQLANALDHSHSRGILHLDLKPSHIMFAADQVSVRITDFGIAQVQNQPLGEGAAMDHIMASPRYMSPEQANDIEPGPGSDLFSLGSIFYEMLSARKAFNANTLPGLIQQIREEEPIPLHTLTPETPAGLVAIVERLLRKQPAERFPNGSTLARALREQLRLATRSEEDLLD
ncbi:MAG: serine/threonine-protein kinase [Halioglobus sp.]